MRYMLPLESAEPSDMQGLVIAKIDPNYASFLIGEDRIVQDWDNPHPVAVLLQPVLVRSESYGVNAQLGLLVGTRAIPPIGGQALIGGYVQKGESVAAAAGREFREETGLTAEIFHRSMLVGSRATRSGQLLLFVHNFRALSMEQVESLKPSDEMSSFSVITDARTPLCYPLHQEVSAKWLDYHRPSLGYTQPREDFRLY